VNIEELVELYISKREKLKITLSRLIVAKLRQIRDRLVVEGGKRYPLSYLIEDMIAWIVLNPDRLQRFLDETYPPVEK
jgi:hypothetical protein